LTTAPLEETEATVIVMFVPGSVKLWPTFSAASDQLVVPGTISSRFGGDYFTRNIAALAMDGRLVEIGFMGGAASATIDLGDVLRRRLTITGSTLRPRTVGEKGAIAAALQREVWPLLEQGRVKPIVYRTFPLAEAAAAHQLMESSEHVGKIVLVTGGSPGRRTQRNTRGTKVRTTRGTHASRSMAARCLNPRGGMFPGRPGV
jgi:threonine dehydrogenase-like Zn-dependent dehydrogenase